ncbi:MAG TPA: hypothetical protein VK474_06165 [Chthoniobacterales bacterium]|nr:hypothetical protein [Chthoniobacterales bacterium]
MKKAFSYTLILSALAIGLGTAHACDVCGCQTPQIETIAPVPEEPAIHPAADQRGAREAVLDRFYFGAAEQFTHFATVQIDGREVPNPSGQYEDSSITQLTAGVVVTPRLSLQINLPLIYRSFERPEGFAIDRGTESGVGDISLLANFVLFQSERNGEARASSADGKNPLEVRDEPNVAVAASVFGGVKLPTGDSDRLREEFDEVEVPGAPESGIHGHDLTLGTGSFDAIIGGQASLRYRSCFVSAETQFTLRGDGAHQYHFANDLSWSGGPGYYLMRRRDAVVGLQCACAGEHKDVDRFRGEVADDTGITSVFLGPRVIGSYRKLSGELALEFPVAIENTALQVVPDYRLRASFTVRF